MKIVNVCIFFFFAVTTDFDIGSKQKKKEGKNWVILCHESQQLAHLLTTTGIYYWHYKRFFPFQEGKSETNNGDRMGGRGRRRVSVLHFRTFYNGCRYFILITVFLSLSFSLTHSRSFFFTFSSLFIIFFLFFLRSTRKLLPVLVLLHITSLFFHMDFVLSLLIISSFLKCTESINSHSSLLNVKKKTTTVSESFYFFLKKKNLLLRIF